MTKHPTQLRHPLTGGVCRSTWLIDPAALEVCKATTEHHEPRHVLPFRALLGTSPIPYAGRHRRSGAVELKAPRS